MPRSEPKLADAQIAALAQWIKCRRTVAGRDGDHGRRRFVAASRADKVITAEQRAFWSFQPIAAPAVPAVTRTDWAKTDIDRFILARLESEGLAPVADRRQADADPSRDARSDGLAADA